MIKIRTKTEVLRRTKRKTESIHRKKTRRDIPLLIQEIKRSIVHQTRRKTNTTRHLAKTSIAMRRTKTRIATGTIKTNVS